MAYPPLSYKSGELSQGEIALLPGALNPMTDGAALQLLGGAAALRRGAAADAQDAYRQDLALAIAKQNEETRSHMATELGTGLNSTNPQALPLMAQLDPTRGIFSSGGGGGINANVAALVDASTRGRAREQDAGIQEKYASALKSNVESGYTTPPDVAAGQLGYQPNMNDPLQLRVVAAHEAAANARHAGDLAAAGAPKPPNITITQDPNNPSKTIFGMQATDPRVAVSGAATIRNMNEFMQPIPTYDASGRITGYSAPQNTPLEMQAPVRGKRGVYQGQVSIPIGTSTGAAGAALPPAPASRNSSAPPSSSVRPDAATAPAATPVVQPSGQAPNAVGGRVALPSTAPADLQITPDARPNATAAEALAVQYNDLVQRSRNFDTTVKQHSADLVAKGRYTLGRDQTGRSWLMIDNQPVMPARTRQ